MRILPAATSFVLVFAGVSSADSDVVVAGNTTIAAAFAAGGEVHAYRATVPAGARITVALKPAKHGPTLHATLTGALGETLGDKTGKAPAFKSVAAAASGRYVLTVASADGASTGGYAVAVAWKAAKGAAKTVVVEPGGEGTIEFSGDAGANAVITLKKAKRSTAAPVLESLQGPDGASVPLAAGASTSIALSGTGDFVARFGAGAAGGSVKAVVSVKPPKTQKIAVPLSALAGGAAAVALKTIGPPGGTLALASGPLDGASVAVPAGALGAPTSVLLGPAFTIAGGQAGDAAGPAIFAGPEGLQFAAGKPATVTIPFDPSVFGGDASKLRVYTRGAGGVVTLVPDPVVDLANHLVTFQTSHFSAFQVLNDFHFAETQRAATAAGTTTKQLGACLALSGDIAVAGRLPAGSTNSWEVAAYHRVGGAFVEEATLTPPSTQSFDGFASTIYSVAASGDRVLVGSPGRTTSFGIHSGAGFVFHRDPSGGVWTMEAELALPTWDTNQFTGGTVALDGDTALLAAPGAARVSVFVRDATSGVWSFQQDLPRPADGNFGYQPAVQGDTAVVLGFSLTSSTLHVYRRASGAWTEVGKIEAPAIGGNPGSIGAPRIDGTTIAAVVAAGGSPVGEIRLYQDLGTTFPEVARISVADVIGPGESPGAGIPRSFSLRGDLLLAGAPAFSPLFPGATTSVVNGGNAFLWRRIGGKWRLAARLRGTPNDAFPLAAQDAFGSSVALDGTTAVVSAPVEQTPDGRPGALYVFDLSGN